MEGTSPKYVYVIYNLIIMVYNVWGNICGFYVSALPIFAKFLNIFFSAPVFGLHVSEGPVSQV